MELQSSIIRFIADNSSSNASGSPATWDMLKMITCFFVLLLAAVFAFMFFNFRKKNQKNINNINSSGSVVKSARITKIFILLLIAVSVILCCFVGIFNSAWADNEKNDNSNFSVSQYVDAKISNENIVWNDAELVNNDDSDIYLTNVSTTLISDEAKDANFKIMCKDNVIFDGKPGTSKNSSIVIKAKESVPLRYSSDINIDAAKKLIDKEAFRADFKCENKILDSIKIKKTPDKMEYHVGESLVTDGMVVEANFTDGTSRTLSDTEYSCSPTKFDVSGDVKVDVSFTQGEITKSDSFTVVVLESHTYQVSFEASENGNIYDNAQAQGEPIKNVDIEVGSIAHLGTCSSNNTIGTISFESGSSVKTFYAVPNTDYEFHMFSGIVDGQVVDSDLSISATYIKSGKEFGITIDDSKIKEFGYMMIDKKIAEKGDTINIGFVPNEPAYILESVKVVGQKTGIEVTPEAISDNKTKFIMPEESVVVTPIVELKEGATFTDNATLNWKQLIDGVDKVVYNYSSGEGNIDETYVKGAFRDCLKLKYMNVKSSCVSIGEYSFCDCNNLERLVLDKQISNIDRCAFYGSKNLKTVKYDGEEYKSRDKLMRKFVDNGCIANPSAFQKTGLLQDYFIVKHDNKDRLGYKPNMPSFVIPEYVKEGNIDSHVCAIDDEAFSNKTILENIKLPDSINFLDYGCFKSCIKLSSINLPENLLYIGMSAFESCSSLTGLLVLPDNLKYIGDLAFSNCCNLTSIKYKGEVFTQGQEHELLNALKESGVKFDDENTVFMNSGMCADEFSYEEIEPGKICITKWNYSKKDLEIPSMLDGKTVVSLDDDSFKDNSLLVSVTVPETITSIGMDAFKNCFNLESVNLKAVESIGSRAFANCQLLNNIKIANSLNHLEYDIFANCPSLVNVNYNNVDYSEGQGSLCLDAMETAGVEILDKPGVFGNSGMDIEFGYYLDINDKAVITSFNRYKSNMNIPSNIDGYLVSQIDNGAFKNANYVTHVILPDTITKICSEAFNNCYKLSSAEFKSSTFDDTYNLIKKLEQSSVVVEDSAFDNTGIKQTYFILKLDNAYSIGYNESMEEFTIPDTYNIDGLLVHVVKITEHAFGVQNNVLKKLNISNNIEIIDGWVFREYSALNEVVLPSNLKKIGEAAFYKCKNLSNVKYLNVTYKNGQGLNCLIAMKNNFVDIGVEDPKDSNIFRQSGMIERFSVNIVDNKAHIEAYNWDEEVVEIPSNIEVDGVTYPVTQLDSRSFEQRLNLTTVSIPDSIVDIKRNVFNGSRKLSLVKYNSHDIRDTYSFYTAFKEKTGKDIDVYTIFKETNMKMTYLVLDYENLEYIGYKPGSEKCSIPLVYEKDGYTYHLIEISTMAFKYEGRLSVVAFEGKEYTDTYSIIDALKSKNIKIEYEAFYLTKLAKTCLFINNLNRGEWLGWTESTTNLDIPFNISRGGYNYKVIKLETYAFSNCKNLQKVSLDKDIKTLSYGCFAGCTNLKTFVFNNHTYTEGQGDDCMKAMRDAGMDVTYDIFEGSGMETKH